jgi:lysine 2,3-aminomutase
MEIMEGLRGHMSGIGLPTYVVDSPHGGGKIPLMPNYLVSMSDDAVILRNYEGMLVRYQAEDKPGTINKTGTRGVSGLIQGDKTSLMPEGNERMARRRKLQLVDEETATGGCGGGGQPEPPQRSNILSLPMMNSPQQVANG